MKCNYDTWNTKVPKGLNEEHIAVLKLMADGKTRARCDMLRDARPPTDPNPRSENGFAGWNKIDYNLYKKGLLICTKVSKVTKFFRISAKGLRQLSKSVPGAYIGPEGFGASPESGGTVATGENRIQSLKPYKYRMTNEVKEEILEEFESWSDRVFVGVVKIDKTRKGYIRVWYNGSLHVPYI